MLAALHPLWITPPLITPGVDADPAPHFKRLTEFLITQGSPAGKGKLRTAPVLPYHRQTGPPRMRC